MGYGHSLCEVEKKKVFWPIGLVLASLVIIHYFQVDLPYRGPKPNGSFVPEDIKQETLETSIGIAPAASITIPTSFSSGIAPAPMPSTSKSSVPEEPKQETLETTNDIAPTIPTSLSSGISPTPTSNSVPFKSDDHNGNSSHITLNNDNNNKSSKKSVMTISEMNDMLARSRVLSHGNSGTYADEELLYVRSQIENAPSVNDHPTLYLPLYRNLSTFLRSYELMEEKLKVFMYKEGNRPVFRAPRLTGIYASEGWFLKLMMKPNNKFLTNNPSEAHLFYFPFSSQLLVDFVYVKDSHTFDDITGYLKNYLHLIKTTHPFWNRTRGADHFLVACHDWAPVETRQDMANCIRALCNSDVKEGFKIGKDVSLPETRIHSSHNPTSETGGIPPSRRHILAFFAGKMHGYVRPILLQHWENKDPDMKIFGRIKRNSYIWHMKVSKFCICAKGYEVNSPRVVEAISYGCVPVIVSDNFVPPFFDVLRWEEIAVFVLEKDIPDLKNILVGIPDDRYRAMHRNVERVRLHFLWHSSPLKFDVFHMILHSVWYNRVLRSMT